MQKRRGDGIPMLVWIFKRYLDLQFPLTCRDFKKKIKKSQKPLNISTLKVQKSIASKAQC